MIGIRIAKPNDIRTITEFAVKIKEDKKILPEIPMVESDFASWITECILSSGVIVFVATDNEAICGFIVLNETACPWNNLIRYGVDLMFVAEKGGLKLIRTAKQLAKKKNWDKLILTTSTNNERSDKLMEKLANKIGGVYEIPR
jgi:hypothetical protein